MKKKAEEDDITELFPELKKNLEEFEKESMPELETLDTSEFEKELEVESPSSDTGSKEERAKKPQKEIEEVKQQLQAELWRQKFSKKHPLDEKIEKLKKELGLI